jgi:membrane protein YqaA with SNARE-associated domain
MAAVPIQRPGPGRLVKPVLGLVLVAAIAVAAVCTLGDADRRQALELMLQSPMGLVGLFALSVLSSATLLLPVPGVALTILAATVADPIVVGIVAGLGQTVGELTGYMAGASGGAILGNRIASSRMASWMRRRGALTLFLLGLIPNPAFDVAGMLAGALRLPVMTFVAAAGCGKVVRNVVIAWAAARGLGIF